MNLEVKEPDIRQQHNCPNKSLSTQVYEQSFINNHQTQCYNAAGRGNLQILKQQLSYCDTVNNIMMKKELRFTG